MDVKNMSFDDLKSVNPPSEPKFSGYGITLDKNDVDRLNAISLRYEQIKKITELNLLSFTDRYLLIEKIIKGEN